MVEAMEVEDGAVALKQESATGAEAHDPQETEVEDLLSVDKVTTLQDSIDKMALTMFNALRLLPASLGDGKTREENVEAIKLLAKDVLATVKETDSLIDELPGLDKTEDEQLEELRRLQIQSEEEAQTLRQVAEEAGSMAYHGGAEADVGLCAGPERWMDRARDSLRVISETRLRR